VETAVNVPKFVSSFLKTHVGRFKLTRNLREDTGIDDTEASSSADLELAVEYSHLVVVSANGARGRGVVAPHGVLDVGSDLVVALNVGTRQSLVNLDSLGGERLAGKADGLGDRGDILLVVTVAGVEVVVGDLGDIERVGRLELDGSGLVAGVRLEDGPGEPVMVIRCVKCIAGVY
jgi:hypothetical protein